MMIGQRGRRNRRKGEGSTPIEHAERIDVLTFSTAWVALVADVYIVSLGRLLVVVHTLLES